MRPRCISRNISTAPRQRDRSQGKNGHPPTHLKVTPKYLGHLRGMDRFLPSKSVWLKRAFRHGGNNFWLHAMLNTHASTSRHSITFFSKTLGTSTNCIINKYLSHYVFSLYHYIFLGIMHPDLAILYAEQNPPLFQLCIPLGSQWVTQNSEEKETHSGDLSNLPLLTISNKFRIEKPSKSNIRTILLCCTVLHMNLTTYEMCY